MDAITSGMFVVFAIVLAALVLFVTEPVPVDVTAIGIMVALMVLEPWTQISPADGVSGFSSSATITVLAMFILSEGVQRTGAIQLLGAKTAALTRNDPFRQLGATVGIVGPISGFINNTAAVVILLPMVTDLAERSGTSPSKLLLPLSYASMLGGMLTVIGTSTNILASDLSDRLLDHPFSMFEFTHLGALVLVVGATYLLTVGWWLTPARIQPEEDLTEEFRMRDYLTEVLVQADSLVVGRTVHEALEATDVDADLVQLVRDGEVFVAPLPRKTLRAGDVLVVRTARESLVELIDAEGLTLIPEIEVTEAELEAAGPGQNLVEVVIAPGSGVVGDTLERVNFRDQYGATVLAIRHGGELIRQRMDDRQLHVGDALLVQGSEETLDRLHADRDFIVAQEIERPDFRRSKLPIAIGIVIAVVALAAAELLSILVAALAGALAMIVTGCLKPTEIYDAVHWDVIFLLAGVIPLGIAMERTGAALYLAQYVVASGAFLPAIAVLGLFYLFTAVMTNIISNNASVVLMIPIAVEAAEQLNANAFAFVLAVTFAASTAFMTPIGYQTNLFVYGPGGYQFSDYIRVGAPLQLLIAVVTTAGIAVFWGVT